MGMMKFGPKREIMQDRIMEGIVSCIEEISRFTSQEFDVSEIITHTVGNIANDFVFGITYEKDDETWKYLLHLQDEGVKLIGVGAVANFLPLLRWLFKYCIIATTTCLMFYTFTFPSSQIPTHQPEEHEISLNRNCTNT